MLGNMEYFSPEDGSSSQELTATPRVGSFAVASRLIFTDEARGVPALSRGWRTPDPSPMPGEGDRLPRCRAKQVGVVDVEPDTPRGRGCEWQTGSRGGSRDASEHVDDEIAKVESWGESQDASKVSEQRVSSPARSVETVTTSAENPPSLPDSDVFASRVVFQEEERCVPRLLRGWRTPDPSPTREGGVRLPRCKAPEVSVVEADPALRGRSGARENLEPGPQRPLLEPAAGQVPPPPQPWKSSSDATSEEASADAALSLGSIGHPFACTEGCKYFRRARGCKDGASCSRCHLCDWKRGKAKTDAEQPKEKMQLPSRPSRRSQARAAAKRAALSEW